MGTALSIVLLHGYSPVNSLAAWVQPCQQPCCMGTALSVSLLHRYSPVNSLAALLQPCNDLSLHRYRPIKHLPAWLQPCQVSLCIVTARLTVSLRCASPANRLSALLQPCEPYLCVDTALWTVSQSCQPSCTIVPPCAVACMHQNRCPRENFFFNTKSKHWQPYTTV